MLSWCKVRGRLTLHLFSGGRSLCGVAREDEIEIRGARSNSLCTACKMRRHGFSTLQGDNDYMDRHFKALGLSPVFPVEVKSR